MNEANIIKLILSPQKFILRDAILTKILIDFSFLTFLEIISRYPDIYAQLSLKQEYWEKYYRKYYPMSINFYSRKTNYATDNSIDEKDVNWFYEVIQENYIRNRVYYSSNMVSLSEYLITSSMTNVTYRKLYSFPELQNLIFPNNLFRLEDVKSIAYFNIFNIVLLMSSGDLYLIYETKLGSKEVTTKLIQTNISKFLATSHHLLCLSFDNKLIKTTSSYNREKEIREYEYDVIATQIKDINFHSKVVNTFPDKDVSVDRNSETEDFLRNKGKMFTLYGVHGVLSMLDMKDNISIYDADNFNIYHSEEINLLRSAILVLTAPVISYDIFIDEQIHILFRVKNGGVFRMNQTFPDEQGKKLSKIYRIHIFGDVKKVTILPIFYQFQITEHIIEEYSWNRSNPWNIEKSWNKENMPDINQIVDVLEKVLYLYQTSDESIYLIDNDNVSSKTTSTYFTDKDLSNINFNSFRYNDYPSIYSTILFRTGNMYSQVNILNNRIYAITTDNKFVYIFLPEFYSPGPIDHTEEGDLKIIKIEVGKLPPNSTYLPIDDNSNEFLFQVSKNVVSFPYPLYLENRLKNKIKIDTIRGNNILFRLTDSYYEFQTTIS